MTRDHALARVRKLLALAGPSSGAAENERRNAALQAAHLVLEHHLLDGGAAPISLDQVADLALHAAALEHQLVTERATHAAAMKTRDDQWRALVDRVRKEERAAVHAQVTTAERKAVREDRSTLGREGGRARAQALDADRKKEIGKAGAAERWARWRERRGIEPR